jgi:hypothetical protein
VKVPQKKLIIDLPYDPTILFLGMYPKECKSIYMRDTCITMFTAALFKKAKLKSAEVSKNQ